MAAMTHDRLLHYEILDGNGNADRFCHFIDNLGHERDIANLPRDSILVMDNASFHLTEAVVDMLEIRGFEYRYLPPYCPFFNPIENHFSQWKGFVRRERSRSTDELMNAINQ